MSGELFAVVWYGLILTVLFVLAVLAFLNSEQRQTKEGRSIMAERDHYRKALEEAHAKLWKLAELCDGAAAIGVGIVIIVTEIHAALEAPGE